jgi:hypothetical protein
MVSYKTLLGGSERNDAILNLGRGFKQQILVGGRGEDDEEEETRHRKTSLIRANYDLTLVQISGSPNYRNVTENIVTWRTREFLGNDL